MQRVIVVGKLEKRFRVGLVVIVRPYPEELTSMVSFVKKLREQKIARSLLERDKRIKVRFCVLASSLLLKLFLKADGVDVFFFKQNMMIPPLA